MPYNPGPCGGPQIPSEVDYFATRKKEWEREFSIQSEKIDRLYHATLNSLYVWKMIALLHHNNALLALFQPKGRDSDWTSNLPSWCSEYLATVATDLLTLATRVDIKDIPNELENIMHWATTSNLPTSEQLDRTAIALGFFREGRTIFQDFVHHGELIADHDRYSRLRAEGLLHSEAIDRLTDTWGLKDIRSTGRRVSKAKAFHQKLSEGAETDPAQDP